VGIYGDSMGRRIGLRVFLDFPGSFCDLRDRNSVEGETVIDEVVITVTELSMRCCIDFLKFIEKI
jgi:hypothetical protein